MYSATLTNDSQVNFKTMMTFMEMKAGSPLHRKNMENVRENTGIWKLCQNTGNFVCSSSKFPETKDAGYCDICRVISNFFKVNFPHEIVANFLNCHREISN